jgi:hypothetical protein
MRSVTSYTATCRHRQTGYERTGTYKKNLLLSCSAGNARFFVPGFSCPGMQEKHANPGADFSKKIVKYVFLKKHLFIVS